MMNMVEFARGTLPPHGGIEALFYPAVAKKSLAIAGQAARCRLNLTMKAVLGCGTRPKSTI
jgi:hypothetical protein